MKKRKSVRKVSVEKNSGYVQSFARSSVASLQTIDTNQQRHSRSTKLPSFQNLHNPDSSDKFGKFEDNQTILQNEMQSPKTRFNSRSRSKEARSTSSPRLKSFPAEKIKKLENPSMFSPEPIVQQDSRKTGTFLVTSSARNNNGYGDAMPTQLSLHQQPKPQDTSDMSQQQFVGNHQQIRQTSSLSESIPNQRISSLERQTHRPFVPNILQGAVISDRSSQIPSAILTQPVIVPTLSKQPTTSQAQQASSDSHAVIDQNRNEAFECETQPVGGRNAVNHRQMQIQQPAIVQDVGPPLNDRSANNQNVYRAQLHGSCQWNPHRINEQTQHDAYRQQMLPQALNQMKTIPGQQQHIHHNSGTYCRHYSQPLPAIQISEQGMTSPQDATVNQMKLIQRLPIHQQNIEHPVNMQSSWPRNDVWMQTANQNQQHLYQHPSPQWQYYYAMQDSNFNQQNSRRIQDQSNPSQNKTNYELTNQQSISKAYNQQNEGKKMLQFTPDMIRDQELLVSTMRQQHVPAEVMRRQFDALLNEQRRHLAYIAQFHQQEADVSEVKKTRLVRRRTERDEKPEWMIHITPPRISYSEIERIKVQQRDSKEQCLMGDKSKEKSKIMTDQQNCLQQKKEEFTNQVIPPQMYVQMNPLWQQQVKWPYKNDHQTLCGYATCYPYTHQQNIPNNLYCQPNLTFNKYMKHPHAVRYDPYCSGRQKIWSNEYNPNSLNTIDNQKTPMDSAHFYERDERPIESSSLLKMRMYKEKIRPQKRNNGLQDPDNIQKVLETLKDAVGKKGLEYLANLAKRKPVIRLNGIQDVFRDPDEIPKDMQSRPPVDTTSQPRKKIPANGLANSRNLNNPPPRVLRPKRADEPPMMEYPRQRQNARIYGMQAEKENGMVATSQRRGHTAAISHAQDARSIPYDQQNAFVTQGRPDDNVMVFQYGGAPSQHYHETQKYYLDGHNGGQGDVASMQRPDAPGTMRIDRAAGDTVEKTSAEKATKRMGGGVQAMHRTNAYDQPEIREARTIGGITYLIRKPEYTLTNPVVSPDKINCEQTFTTPKNILAIISICRRIVSIKHVPPIPFFKF